MNKLENYMKGEDSGPKDDTTVSGKFPLLGPKSLWYRVIIDEAQCIKNPKTKNAKAAHRLKSEFRWCLSGTPMMNNVFELSSLVTFLRIEPYCAADQFKQVGSHERFTRRVLMSKLTVIIDLQLFECSSFRWISKE